MFSQDQLSFVHKERHLRNYHIRNWLQMNRTNQELLELSLNYFYGEQPKLLGWSLDILDGEPKGLIVASIIRESGANAAQAEVLYEQLQSRIAQCRGLVDEVTRDSKLTSAQSKQMLHDRVARAGVMPMGYSPVAATGILIVNRPTIISVCVFLLFLTAALTTLFVLAEITGMEKFEDVAGNAGLVVITGFTILCGWGYWNMKKWAVFLYMLDPIARFLLGMPHALIALPIFIAAFGLMHLKEMTWK